jgi:hypothetical protein
VRGKQSCCRLTDTSDGDMRLWFRRSLQISRACDNPGSVMAFPGTSHERFISWRSLAPSLFECFVQFSRRRPKTSTTVSPLVSAKSSPTTSSAIRRHHRVVGVRMATGTNRQEGPEHMGKERYRCEEKRRHIARPGVAVATIGVVLKEAGTQGGREPAAAGRADGA